MPVMGFVRFERFFRTAGGVDADRNDMKRYLEFVNCTIYDLLLIGQAHAESAADRDAAIEAFDVTAHIPTTSRVNTKLGLENMPGRGGRCDPHRDRAKLPMLVKRAQAERSMLGGR